MRAVRRDPPTGVGPAVRRLAPGLAVLSGAFAAHPGCTPGRGRGGRQGGATPNRAAARGRRAPPGAPDCSWARGRLHADRALAASPPSAPGRAPPTSQPPVAPASAGPAGEAVVPPRVRPTRSLCTRKGRPPLRLAGSETSARLHRGARGRRALLAPRSKPRPVGARPPGRFVVRGCTHPGVPTRRRLAPRPGRQLSTRAHATQACGTRRWPTPRLARPRAGAV